MALPAVAYVLLFMYKPMYGIVIAFKNYKYKLGIAGSAWAGMENFARLFNSYWFPVILSNTLSISLLSLLLGFPAPILLALMANEIRSERVRKVFLTVSYAPHFISTVAMCGMILMFLSPTSGIVNRLIEALGGEAVFFMQGADAFKWVYALTGIWQEVGWGAIIYYAALAGVDRELLEAAQIDGANRLQRVWHINLPVLAPTIVVMFILNCGSLLNVGYEKTYLLQNSTNLPGSEVISTYVYKMGLEKKDFSFSTAVGLFNSVVNCLVLVATNALARRISGSGIW